MRGRVLVCTGLLTGMAVLVTEPALAAGGVTVDPDPVYTGATATVRATCDDESDSAIAFSAAFDSVRAPLRGANRFQAPVNIKQSISADTYSVTVKCESGTKVYGSVSVLRKKRHRPDPYYPHGGAMTGGGGTQGPGLPGAWTSAGLALLLGAAGVGGLALYRARRRDGI